ncbi:hypothetical protein [Urbifossiella limnaea]|uniref:Uncharacterized protein n=1 Tax=Urbifossiella limnaea TaxID=2528023 RepID=A0A517XUQ7_9BACT|nr:hypothetical protein [Urbifossiella limnaea]QDU21232.1 hypothetical protein ETAA1_31970 [Urbifossiella limnaea]
MTTPVLDREEYVEQAHLFHTVRERLGENLPVQDILLAAHDELLTTTRLPFAVQFLVTELKHSGHVGSGFAKLPHYFTPFQTFVVTQAETAGQKFEMRTAFLVLEREAAYKAAAVSQAGLFVYQFETVTRNRLGYNPALDAMALDPHYDPVWKEFVAFARRQMGVIDLGQLVYLRSEQYVADVRRGEPTYEPPVPPVFGVKEGKIGKASRGREPVYLFSALQRQLGYPEVPKPNQRDDLKTKLDVITGKLKELEQRIRLAEGELRGSIDLSQFGKPDILKKDDEE